MKKVILLFLTFVVFNSYSQVTLTLQPDSTEGKDAYLRSLDDVNRGNHPDFIAQVGTNQAEVVVVRNVIEFDISSIPEHSLILEAKLSLYHNDLGGNIGHRTTSGSNSTLLQRAVEPWAESTVTWNSQPAVTSINQVILPASTSDTADYLNIDVKNIYQDMVNNKSGSHGMVIKLINESGFRSLKFSSSDFEDPAKRPKLEITYIPYIETIDNVGIGTDDPKAKLHIQEGDIFLEQIGSGIILKSVDEKCFKVSIDSEGNFIKSLVVCPN